MDVYRGLALIYRLPPDKIFEPVYPTVKMAWCSPFNECCYQPSANNDFIVSETNGSVGAVVILLLNTFEQSAIH